MKIRQGFVSNSSSSSFVIVTSVENHEKALKELDEFERAVAEAMMSRSGTLFGKEIMCGEEVSCESWYTLSELNLPEEITGDREDYELSNDKEEAWLKYQRLLERHKDELFTYRADL